MGRGFETWAASHIVEGKNKTLITPQLVQFLNMQWLKFLWSFRANFITYNIEGKITDWLRQRAFFLNFIKHLMMINIPSYLRIRKSI